MASLSDEEIDAWIERIAQGGLAASPFIVLSPELQRILAFTMACQLAAYRSGTSSSGSPLDEPLKNDVAADDDAAIDDSPDTTS